MGTCSLTHVSGIFGSNWILRGSMEKGLEGLDGVMEFSQSLCTSVRCMGFFYVYYLFLCMYVCIFHDMHAEVRGQLQELVLSSVLWVLGMELKALDLSASTLPADHQS